MAEVKKIGVLTSGGDAPGMNAAVRAVVRAALNKNKQVLGIYEGYQGLLGGNMKEFDERSVSNILQRGGTVLHTARCEEFKYEAGVEKAVKICKEFKLDGIVVIGGDGSFRGARDLSLKGIPCVGIPGTIDNDISCSEYSIGFDTAINTVVDMVDKLRDTAESHSRVSVVEVMGRGSGEIALNSGIAVGATSILVSEFKWDIKADIIDRINASLKTGKKHFIIIVSEAVGGCDEIAKNIHDGTGLEARVTILGHVQRGGTPTCIDRVIATQMGAYAVELLNNGIGNRVVVMQNKQITDFDIFEALKMKKSLNREMYDVSYDVSI